MLNRLNPKIIAVSSLTAFPGTKLYEEVRSGSFTMPDEAERLEELKTFLSEIQLRVHLEASSKSNAVPVMGMLPLDKALIIAKLEAAIEEERRTNPNRHFRAELSSLGWDKERSEDLSSKSCLLYTSRCV